MKKELKDFKRYCDLLEKVYGLGTTSTASEQKEMDRLAYKLELNGVSDIISDMNFNRLQKQLEKEERK